MIRLSFDLVCIVKGSFAQILNLYYGMGGELFHEGLETETLKRRVGSQSEWIDNLEDFVEKNEQTRTDLAKNANKAKSKILQAKNLRPTRDIISLLQALTGSPYTAARALQQLATKDERREFRPDGLRYALGTLEPKQLLTDHPPTVGRIVHTLLTAESRLSQRKLADATAINFDRMYTRDLIDRAEMTGELPKDAVKRTDDGSKQANGQDTLADITQVQSVGQENISLQHAAIALATKKSDATARQVSYQGNFNAQVASAEALNVSDGHCSGSAVLHGTDANGDKSWALAYENGDTDEQTAAAEIDQLQFVSQLNVNEQFTAIAFAADCGKATAEQLNYQANENVQRTEARAVGEGDGEEKDGKKEKKNGKDKKNEKKDRKDGKEKKDEKEKTKH
ncbi:hypothetical protein [Natronococcus sp. A-GB7]|uniref:hypothetical protein n=1 Tax=Natronococcus sp. A-GB7 TaxID=3037649 RepID=UPI0031B9EF78